MRCLPLVLLLSVLAPGLARAQDAGAAPKAFEVFIDCQTRRCDFDHFRREITFVNYVRDRQDADVHVLVTTQRTGGGGTEFTLAFIGLQQFEDLDETLVFVSEPTATDEEIRTGLTQTLQAGLVRYLSRTPQLQRLQFSYQAPTAEEAAAEPAADEDPWNFWIFRTRARGFLRGESQQSNYNLNGSFSADRVTEAWKVSLGLDGFYSESRFEIDDSTTITNEQSSYGTEGLVVRSLGPHWSAGARAAASHSTFRNEDLRLSLGPAVEYNIFPYDESTRRQFTFLYQVVFLHFDYIEETLFEKTAETLVNTSLTGALEIQQPWGSVETSLEGSVYLHDLSKLRLDLFSELEVRLFRGLSLDLFGAVALVRDQLSLPAGGASEEDILLRRRALGTNFEVFGSVGLSYTFGSRFTNVVNPRFNSGGRRFF